MKSLRRLTIDQRLWLLTGLAVIGMVLGLGLALTEMRGLLMEEKIAQVRKLVETVQSVAVHYQRRAERGEIDPETARSAALAVIRDLRYDRDDYFWVMTLDNRMLMHPLKPALDDQDLSGQVDVEGKPLFTEMAYLAKRDGGGVVDYAWPKPGSDTPVPKISYVQRLPAWDWVVGTGIYVDDVDAVFWRHVLRYGGAGACVLLLILMGARLTARSVVRPIREAAQAMRHIARGDGDLTRRLDAGGRDELAEMATGFNEFAGKTQDTILRVGGATQQIAAAAEELSAITRSSRDETSRQREEIHQVAAAVTEMTATIMEVARHAEQTAAAAAQADRHAERGGATVEGVVDANQRLALEVERIAEAIRHFSDDSVAIGGVLDVIRGVAEQTNLLALNAAIEAARAGEQGRGFAVVAAEVRSLAGRTQASTSEIQQMVESLRAGAQGAVDAIHSGEALTRETLDQAARAREALEQIRQAITQIRDMSTQVASAAEEQAAVAGEIDRSVVSISGLADELSANSQHTAAASQELARLGEELHGVVSVFKVGS